jgi:hypothetical protein
LSADLHVLRANGWHGAFEVLTSHVGLFDHWLAAEQPRRTRAWRRTALLVIGSAVAWAGLWFALRGVVPYDFRIFRRAGAAVLHDRAPYPPLPLTAVGHHHPFVYPLPAAWAFAPFALLGFATGALVFGALSVAAYLAGTWLLGVRSVAVFALVLTSSVVVASLGYGTIDAFLYLGICALVRFRHRPGLTGTVVVILIALKPLMLPLVVYVLATGRLRALVTVVAAGAIATAASVAGGFSVLGYVRLLQQLSTAEAPHSRGVIERIVVDTSLPLGLATAAVAGVAAVALLLTLVAGISGRLDHRIVLAVSVGSALIVSPIVWAHYAAFCWVPLLLLRRTTLVATAAWLGSWLIFPAPLRRFRLPGPVDWRFDHAAEAAVPIAMIVIVVIATLGARRRSPAGLGP